ncbi:DUF732 domain-containing protein [Microbacterium galbinum]|uniref:DUF732 domain-containing protein n=1 Tax=Microbacterium galbinum TaxID=2851646 RepID=A0ABY4IJR2_9MICO|nr:DUF732 domain-containing protein [Microbacterium galbinum]UPL13007.1 DUF732 domain-containing protein [Microbacterium galbinum]
MKNPTKAVALAAALLLAMTLSACGDDAPSSSGESTSTQSRTQSSTAESEAESESPERPEPLVAQSPPSDTDAQFLAEARDRLAGLGSATTIPDASDEQLIAAGHEACDALISQQPFNDVSVIEGEERVQGSFLDSAAIASAGILYFCPEINGKTL